MVTEGAVADVQVGEMPATQMQALAPRGPMATGISAIPSRGEMAVIRQLVADLAPLVGSDFLPKQIDSPHKALAVILKGRELGIPPMEALAQLYVVNGKVTMQAQLMLALIARSGKGAWKIEESDAERCTVTMERSDNGSRMTLTWTIEDAEAAGLLQRWDHRKQQWVENEVWRKYRPAMLRARAISACARIVFPDVIGGLYTPEELDVPVAYDEDSDEIVIDAEAIDLSALENVGAAEESPPCPECGAPMRHREGKRGPFWGCSNYPKCKGTREIEDPFEKHGLPREDEYASQPTEGSEQRFWTEEPDGDAEVDAPADDPREWRPMTLEAFNECVATREWSDERRKLLYQQACDLLWGRVVPIGSLSGKNFSDLFREMVRLGEEAGG